MKKGLGRIPKSLAWIDSVEEVSVMPVKEEVLAKTETMSVQTPIQKKTTQIGLPMGWTRATFIVEEQLNEKLKALAYWERLTVKEIMHDALTQYMQDKDIQSIPVKKIK